uniref:Uncharacterized protein n=1 Tax=Schistosoma curassoni TaxID=6186 RepID=A0A183JDV9_9TREM
MRNVKFPIDLLLILINQLVQEVVLDMDVDNNINHPLD